MLVRRVDYAVCIPTLALSRSGSKGIISGSPKEPPRIDIIVQLYGDIVKVLWKNQQQTYLVNSPLKNYNVSTEWFNKRITFHLKLFHMLDTPIRGRGYYPFI
jgi:hypothetical protein